MLVIWGISLLAALGAWWGLRALWPPAPERLRAPAAPILFAGASCYVGANLLVQLVLLATQPEDAVGLASAIKAALALLVWLALVRWLHRHAALPETEGAARFPGEASAEPAPPFATSLSLPKALASGALLYFSVLPWLFGLHWLQTEWLDQGQPREPVQQNLLSFPSLWEAGPSWPLALMLVALVVLTPIFEEIVFRGCLQSAIREALRSPWGDRRASRAATLLAAAAFVIIHPMETWIVLSPLALVLGFAYERTRSLVAVMTMHALHNALALALSVLTPAAG